MFLFHHDVVVCVLASGSRGNCTYVGDGRRGLVIDCGISTRQIRRRLEALGMPDAPIDAALITHEHWDHCAAARVLDRDVARRTGRHPTFYMTAGTRRGLHPKVVPTCIEHVRTGSDLEVQGIRVETFAVPHDTREPVGYAVDFGHARVGVFTDLGRSTRLVESKLASLDVAVVEFNHDVEQLIDGPYPWRLKQRIRSAHGHLSNAQAADLLATAAADAPRLRHVVLAHLSEENNTPAKAADAAARALHAASRTDITVHLGKQDAPVGPIGVERAEPTKTRPRRIRRRRSPEPEPATGQMSIFEAAP